MADPPYPRHIYPPPWEMPRPGPYLGAGFFIGLVVGEAFVTGLCGIDPSVLYAHTPLSFAFRSYAFILTAPFAGIGGLIAGGIAWALVSLRDRADYVRKTRSPH